MVSSSSTVDCSSSLVVSSSSLVDWSSSRAVSSSWLARCDLLLQLALAGNVQEVDARSEEDAARIQQGDDQELERADLAAGTGPATVRQGDRTALQVHPLETRAQLEGSVGELEVLQRAAQIARGESEHGAKRLIGVDDDAIAVHHQLGRRRRSLAASRR